MTGGTVTLTNLDDPDAPILTSEIDLYGFYSFTIPIARQLLQVYEPLPLRPANTPVDEANDDTTDEEPMDDEDFDVSSVSAELPSEYASLYDAPGEVEPEAAEDADEAGSPRNDSSSETTV